MKQILLVLLLLIITACGPDPGGFAEDFTNGRVLTDKDGCAFTVQKSNPNSSMHLVFNKDETKTGCKYQESWEKAVMQSKIDTKIK